jgi:hypothetical protein
MALVRQKSCVPRIDGSVGASTERVALSHLSADPSNVLVDSLNCAVDFRPELTLSGVRPVPQRGSTVLDRQQGST